METRLFKLASNYLGVIVTQNNYESQLTVEVIARTTIKLRCDGYILDVLKNNILIYRKDNNSNKVQVARSGFSSDHKLNFIEAIGNLASKHNTL
jgi:hypothetical protein